MITGAPKKLLSVLVELSALVAGSAVGYLWWVLHRRYFVESYWFLIGYFGLHRLDFLPANFDYLYALMNLSVALMQGLTVGFAAGCLSRRHPYLFSLAAMLLTFILKVFYVLFDFSRLWNGARHPYETWWVGGLLAIIYISTPLCGTYLAQRILHHRRVKIK